MDSRLKKILWDEYDPAKDAFQSGKTSDDKIWIEVSAYPDPEDMRRWRYGVNIWRKNDYASGPPEHSFSGRGRFKEGKAAAEKFFRGKGALSP